MRPIKPQEATGPKEIYTSQIKLASSWWRASVEGLSRPLQSALKSEMSSETPSPASAPARPPPRRRGGGGKRGGHPRPRVENTLAVMKHSTIPEREALKLQTSGQCFYLARLSISSRFDVARPHLWARLAAALTSPK